jgi:hypothetical protein
MRGVFWRQHKGRFRQIEFGGDGLHLSVRQALCVQDNAERIAGELRSCEDIDGDEVQLHDARFSVVDFDAARRSWNVTTLVVISSG